MAISNVRKFAGKMFRLVPKSNQQREFFIKSEAQQRAKELRKKGSKTRIVTSSNVSKYGGDIAYFLFRQMGSEEEEYKLLKKEAPSWEFLKRRR